MPSFNKSEIIPLDEALEELNKKFEVYKAKNRINGYNSLLYAFLTPELNSEKIDNLKPFKYTVECKRNTGNISLSIYNKPGIPTSDLTDIQIAKLQEFNNYLKQPDIVKYIKKYKMLTLIPSGLIIIAIIIMIFLAKNKML